MIIKTGYYNWNQFGLKDSFYPDDLPIEWRLTFYANEIECVQLLLDDLSDVDDYEDVFEDLPESFEVILQYNAEEQWDFVNELINNEEVSLKGLICNDKNYKQTAAKLIDQSISCFNISQKETLSFADGLKASLILMNDINIVYVDQLYSLKQFRSFIDDLVALHKQENSYLLLDASIYNSAFAGELRLMIDMMGH